MAKFTTTVRRQVRRMTRLTGRKCVPFYNIDEYGDRHGPHIVAIGPIIDAARGISKMSWYANYVDDGINWSGFKGLTK